MRYPRNSQTAKRSSYKLDGRLSKPRKGKTGWASILTVVLTLAMLVVSVIVFYVSSQDTAETRFYEAANGASSAKVAKSSPSKDSTSPRFYYEHR